MKVGVIHVGPLTAGSHYIIRNLIDYSTNNNLSLIGIQWNRLSDCVESKSLNEELLSRWEETREVILPSFPISFLQKRKSEIIQAFDQLECIILLGGNDNQFDDLHMQTKSNVLTVPISILNDVKGSELSLGYDTAVNAVVTNILKIQDTIRSLIYMKPRVFCVQIPGKAYNSLLEDAAMVVEGDIVINPDESSWNLLKLNIDRRYQEGKTYSFILVNETIDPDQIHSHLSEKIDIDFKWNAIDKSQCVGPYPTAIDRILGIKLSQKIIQWLETSRNTDRLLIKGKQIVFERSLDIK